MNLYFHKVGLLLGRMWRLLAHCSTGGSSSVVLITFTIRAAVSTPDLFTNLNPPPLPNNVFLYFTPFVVLLWT